MIDERLVAATRARTVARPSGPAGNGAESRRLLPEPRSRQHLLSGDAVDRAGRDGSLRALTDARFAFRYRVRPTQIRDLIMGSGAETVAATVTRSAVRRRSAC